DYVPHSAAGNWSFALGLIAALVVIGVLIARMQLRKEHDGDLDSDHPGAVVMRFLLFSGLGLGTLGGILGLVGLVQPARKRSFAVVGFGVSALVVAGFAVLAMKGMVWS